MTACIGPADASAPSDRRLARRGRVLLGNWRRRPRPCPSRSPVPAPVELGLRVHRASGLRHLSPAPRAARAGDAARRTVGGRPGAAHRLQPGASRRRRTSRARTSGAPPARRPARPPAGDLRHRAAAGARPGRLAGAPRRPGDVAPPRFPGRALPAAGRLARLPAAPARPGRRRAGGDRSTRGRPAWTTAPRWDEPLARVTPAPPDSFRRADLDHGRRGGPADRPRLRPLRAAGRRLPRPRLPRRTRPRTASRSRTPDFNALLAASEHALAAIADRARRRTAARTGTGPRRLTDALVSTSVGPGAGLFFARDLRDTGSLLPQRSVGGLRPAGRARPAAVVDGGCWTTARGRALPARRAQPWCPATTSRRRRSTPPATGAARRGSTPAGSSGAACGRTARRPARGQPARRDARGDPARRGSAEYVDPVTRTGHGADDFSWTAAVAVDLLASARAEGGVA